MSLPAFTASTTICLCQWSGTAAMMQSISLLLRSSWYRRVTGSVAELVISRERVCRPSYRSHAAAHSTPGRETDVPSKLEPCIPMPIIPNRTLSLGATACGIAHNGSGSSNTVFVATAAPAAALNPRKLRRERAVIVRTSAIQVAWFQRFKIFRLSLAILLSDFALNLFFQHPNRDFFKENNIFVTVDLQA